MNMDTKAKSSVGFISAAYMPIGGTETFHRSLIPKLKDFVNLVGFVATAFHGGDGSKLHVPYSTGVEAAKHLVSQCDTVVVWGIDNLSNIIPEDRPKVIFVHHSDWCSDWNNNNILNQLDIIDEIVCVNLNTAKRISLCGKPTHYIPNCIDHSRIIPSGKQKELRGIHGIPPTSKIVLFGHRLSEEKRPELAIEIAKSLPHNWIMGIAGDGPMRDLVKEQSSRWDNIRLFGMCDSLADWLSISDCFLSLSKFEGFGFSVCEAMAAGVPTVSTPTGISIGLTKTLPNDATTSQWVEAIVNSKIMISSEFILNQFSVDRMTRLWADLLE